jgi:hypothetical protein
MFRFPTALYGGAEATAATASNLPLLRCKLYRQPGHLTANKLHFRVEAPVSSTRFI